MQRKGWMFIFLISLTVCDNLYMNYLYHDFAILFDKEKKWHRNQKYFQNFTFSHLDFWALNMVKFPIIREYIKNCSFFIWFPRPEFFLFCSWIFEHFEPHIQIKLCLLWKWQFFSGSSITPTLRSMSRRRQVQSFPREILYGCFGGSKVPKHSVQRMHGIYAERSPQRYLSSEVWNREKW